MMLYSALNEINRQRDFVAITPRDIERKQYVKESVRMFRELLRPRPPSELDLLVEASRPSPITKEEWAEAERELDREEK